MDGFHSEPNTCTCAYLTRNSLLTFYHKPITILSTYQHPPTDTHQQPHSKPINNTLTCYSDNQHLMTPYHHTTDTLLINTWWHPTITLLTPNHHTTDTLPSHYWHPTITLLTPNHHTTDTLPSHYWHPTITLLTPYLSTPDDTLPSHYWHPTITLLTPYHHTTDTLLINSLLTLYQHYN